MKALSFLSLFLVCVASVAAEELKIGIIDLQKVVSGYYKAQEATSQLKQKETSFLNELQGIRLEGQRLVTEVEDLRKLSLDLALAAVVREEHQKKLEVKLMDVHALEIRLQGVKAQREAELQEDFARVNKTILDEVLAATHGLGRSQGFHLILNQNKANPAQSDVLFSRNVEDLTPKVLASLNATKPARTAEPAAKAPKGK